MSTNEMTQLQHTIAAAGLAKQTQDVLFAAFGPHFEDMLDATGKAATINVTDESQIEQMKAAKVARLEVKKVRTATENTRKATKEDALRFGKAVDNVAGMIKEVCEAVETRLEACETFKERAEAKRREERRVSRVAALAEFGTDTRFMDLAAMEDDAWDSLIQREREALAGRQAKAKADAEAAAKAEEVRRAEESRLREENDRLRREQREREATAAAERAKVEAELAEQRAKIEADRQAAAAILLEAEEKAAREEAERARRERAEAARAAEVERQKRLEAEQAERESRAALNAPDADKLRAVALALRQIEYPNVGDRAQQVIDRVRQGAERMASFVEEQASLLASGAA